VFYRIFIHAHAHLPYTVDSNRFTEICVVQSINGRAQADPVTVVTASQAVPPGFDAALTRAIQDGTTPAAERTAAPSQQPPSMPFRPNPQLALGALPRVGLSLAGHSRSRASGFPGRVLTPAGYPALPPPVDIRLAERIRGYSVTPAGGTVGPQGPQRNDLSPRSWAISLAAYPRPAADNGRGIHWIPTTRQSPEVVDQFIDRAKALKVRWVTFLNEAGDVGGNDYLVSRLTEAGMMPVMRVYSEGNGPIEGDLKALVGHYKALGVSYFQLYNEPNLADENGGGTPDAERYAANWVAAARQVVQAGGLPGLAPLSPQGTAEDLGFLRQSLAAIKAKGGADLLQRSWLSVHNYGRDHLRVRQYDAIVRDAAGRSLPQIGTEAGIFQGPDVSEQEQIRVVSDAYAYLPHREPYYFAYSLWAIANQAGGGHDPRWEAHALYRAEGPTALARALEQG
jgi:hypothetical protein